MGPRDNALRTAGRRKRYGSSRSGRRCRVQALAPRPADRTLAGGVVPDALPSVGMRRHSARHPPQPSQLQLDCLERFDPGLTASAACVSSSVQCPSSPRRSTSSVRCTGSNQPRMADTVLGVDAQLLRAVEPYGPRGKHFTHPVGCECEIGRSRQTRQARPAPSGEVGDDRMPRPRCSSGSRQICQPPWTTGVRRRRAARARSPVAGAPAHVRGAVPWRRPQLVVDELRRRDGRARRRGSRRTWPDDRVRFLAWAASCPSPPAARHAMRIQACFLGTALQIAQIAVNSG